MNPQQKSEDGVLPAKELAKDQQPQQVPYLFITWLICSAYLISVTGPTQYVAIFWTVATGYLALAHHLYHNSSWIALVGILLILLIGGGGSNNVFHQENGERQEYRAKINIF